MELTANDRAELTALMEHVQKERDFNEGWIAIHTQNGHALVADRRRSVTRERDGWIAALRNVLGLPATEKKP